MANKSGANFAEPKPPAAARRNSGDDRDGSNRGAATAPGNAGADAAPGARPTQVAAAAPTTTAAAAATRGSGRSPPLYNQVCSRATPQASPARPSSATRLPGLRASPQGVDALTANVIKGKGAMPPKGGSSASEADLKAVVTYMVNASK